MGALLVVLCQIGLALTLLTAATGKFLNSAQFLAALRLSRVPRALVIPIALITPIVELVLAIGLLTSDQHTLPIVLSATAILLCVFTAWMYHVQLHGLRIECGCFGTGDVRIGWSTIVRNVILVVASLIGAWLAVYVHSPIAHPSLWLFITVIAAVMTIALLQSLMHAHRNLVLSPSQLEKEE